MYVIYETATGKKISDSANPIENPRPEVWTVKEVVGPRGVWNAQTLDFTPFPVKPRSYTKLEFLKRLSFVELAGIIEASKTNPMVAAIEKMFDSAEEIILTDDLTVSGISMYRDLGLITEERAAQILGGADV